MPVFFSCNNDLPLVLCLTGEAVLYGMGGIDYDIKYDLIEFIRIAFYRALIRT